MKKQFLIFFSIVFSFYGVINAYIFFRLSPVFPEEYFGLFTITFIVIALAYLLGRRLEKKYGGSVTRFVVYLGAFYMGAMVYLLLGFFLTELVYTTNVLIPDSRKLVDFVNAENRRILILSIVSVSVLTVIMGYINARLVRIKELKLEIKKNGGQLECLKLAVVSDIHLGTIIGPRRLRGLKDKLNSMAPDIILFPGDILDEDLEVVIRNDLGSLLREIKSKYGIYAVNGNHEYIGGVGAADGYLTEHGINLLRDETVLIDNSFYIIGREDISSNRFAGKKRKQLNELMEGINKELPLIMLDHQPFKLNQAEENKIDLQLSGHTHHGQLFPFNFITKKVYEVSYGYKKKGDTHYYVSCGFGTWGPPIKTTARPEIVVIDLKFTG
ncbi:MAG: metallophosphoesterase [Ignavibacteriaceae bacterium]|nr:metallophosphoesterase [Ignavibacteriaceae bacterium]